MNIIKTIEQYDNNNIYFCEPIKNNIVNDGIFSRILYSSPYFTMNGINLLIQLKDIIVEKYYNKYKCSFNPYKHRDIIERLKDIEEGLLKKAGSHKSPQYKINEQLKHGVIKIFSEPIEGNDFFILKISGIWETDNEYGVTYKFSKVQQSS
jgi:hypothetical protein